MPENHPVPELKFSHLAPNTWYTLGILKRTGWVNRGVRNPETVQEHTLALRHIAISLFDQLTAAEKNGLLEMLEIHDWPEAIHGDEVVLFSTEEAFKALKSVKFEKERIALSSICSTLADAGEEIMQLWLRYATSPDDAASFARQLDKYQAVERALEYEKNQGLQIFMEFANYEHSLQRITHPILLNMMKNLEEQWKSLR